MQIPCFLCSRKLPKRTDKNDKPYFVCDPCGVQIFIRRKQGIDNLAELIAQLEEHDFRLHEHSHVLYEIQAVLAEIRGVRKEIEPLENQYGFLMSERALKVREHTLKLLNERIDNLLRQLARLAERGTAVRNELPSRPVRRSAR